jgi:hypothetical protein
MEVTPPITVERHRGAKMASTQRPTRITSIAAYLFSARRTMRTERVADQNDIAGLDFGVKCGRWCPVVDHALCHWTSLASRTILAKRIIEMADQGLMDVTELRDDALAFVQHNPPSSLM